MKPKEEQMKIVRDIQVVAQEMLKQYKKLEPLQHTIAEDVVGGNKIKDSMSSLEFNLLKLATIADFFYAGGLD